MPIFKRPVLSNEQYRLITAIDRAREGMRQLHQRRLIVSDGTMGHIPLILTEIRYRYLLFQARKKGWSNQWYLD